jgi:hypothetical protein
MHWIRLESSAVNTHQQPSPSALHVPVTAARQTRSAASPSTDSMYR